MKIQIGNQIIATKDTSTRIELTKSGTVLKNFLMSSVSIQAIMLRKVIMDTSK